MKKVVLTGPESTGKTTLSRHLGELYGCPVVSEYARTYLDKIYRQYNQDDLTQIAKGQINQEKILGAKSGRLICDTDLLTIKVWTEYKYGSCDPWIIDELNKNLPLYYLICYPDLEWEYDPQRENKDDRFELFDIYIAEIKSLNIPYKIIKGQGDERYQNASLALAEINF